MLTIIVGNIGSGKTLYMTYKAKEYRLKYPISSDLDLRHPIFANYNLKLDNFIYTPYMFIPFSELESSLFLIDDIQFLRNMENLFALQVNTARKLKLDVMISAQDKIQVIARMRRVAHVFLRPVFIKKSDLLILFWYKNEIDFDDNRYYKITYITDIIKEIGNLYDTNQIVNFNDDKEIILEIQKYSKNDKDLRFNLFTVYSNERKRNVIYKKITGKNLID